MLCRVVPMFTRGYFHPAECAASATKPAHGHGSGLCSTDQLSGLEEHSPIGFSNATFICLSQMSQSQFVVQKIAVANTMFWANGVCTRLPKNPTCWEQCMPCRLCLLRLQGFESHACHLFSATSAWAILRLQLSRQGLYKPRTIHTESTLHNLDSAMQLALQGFSG